MGVIPLVSIFTQLLYSLLKVNWQEHEYLSVPEAGHAVAVVMAEEGGEVRCEERCQ